MGKVYGIWQFLVNMSAEGGGVIRPRITFFWNLKKYIVVCLFAQGFFWKHDQPFFIYIYIFNFHKNRRDLFYFYVNSCYKLTILGHFLLWLTFLCTPQGLVITPWMTFSGIWKMLSGFLKKITRNLSLENLSLL